MSRRYEFVCVADGGHGVFAVAVGADGVGVLLCHDGAADDYLAVRLILAEKFYGFFHIDDRCRHEGRESHEADIFFERRFNDDVGRYVAAQVNNFIAVVFQENLDDIFPIS